MLSFKYGLVESLTESQALDEYCLNKTILIQRQGFELGDERNPPIMISKKIVKMNLERFGNRFLFYKFIREIKERYPHLEFYRMERPPRVVCTD